MIILGIDPGLAHTGWGVISGSGSTYRAVAYGCTNTKSADSTPTRLREIFDAISEVVQRYDVDEIAIEDVYFGVNAKSAFALGQARGAAIMACSQCQATVFEYPPAVIKQVITGHGRATKEQILYMVKTLLELDHEPKPDHCSDALGIALTHTVMSRQNKLREG